MIKGLRGESNVVECAYVKSDVTKASYFATPLRFGVRLADNCHALNWDCYSLISFKFEFTPIAEWCRRELWYGPAIYLRAVSIGTGKTSTYNWFHFIRYFFFISGFARAIEEYRERREICQPIDWINNLTWPVDVAKWLLAKWLLSNSYINNNY